MVVNQSDYVYKLNSSETFTGMFQQSNNLTNGSLAYAFLFIIWVVTFYSLQNYPNMDSFKAATWVTWLTSAYLSIIKVIEPSFAILLFLVVLAVTGYSGAKPRR